MGLLLDDLRKRRVVRVGLGYLVTAVALVLAIGAFERLVTLPEWTTRMVAGVAFVLMPFVLVMTWALEDTGPENLRPVRPRR